MKALLSPISATLFACFLTFAMAPLRASADDRQASSGSTLGCRVIPGDEFHSDQSFVIERGQADPSNAPILLHSQESEFNLAFLSSIDVPGMGQFKVTHVGMIGSISTHIDATSAEFPNRVLMLLAGTSPVRAGSHFKAIVVITESGAGTLMAPGDSLFYNVSCGQ